MLPEIRRPVDKIETIIEQWTGSQNQFFSASFQNETE